jgi:hypothetical protein
MRKPVIGTSTLAVAAVVVAVTTATAQERVRNRVAGGDFESAGVSLVLPAAAGFPVFSGGWASRGTRTLEIVGDNPFAGVGALRIETRPNDSVEVIQDLPLADAGYALHFAFLIEDGSQTVRLLSDWDRQTPSSGVPAFEARISTSGIRFATPAGVWRWSAPISPREWHSLSVIADPRLGTQNVRFDGAVTMSMPGVPFLRRSTLVLAGSPEDAGAFRYDAFTMVTLADLELAAITDAAAAWADPARTAFLARVAAARAALERGSGALALAELDMAQGLLTPSRARTADLYRALSELIALIEANTRREPGS